MSADEIRALLNEASPGDWCTSEADPGVVLDAAGQPIAVFGGGRQSYRDAAFTAAAKAAVGHLLDRIAELEAQLDGDGNG